MGYHEHRKIWVPIVGDTLQCDMDHSIMLSQYHIVDKYAVAVIKKGKVVTKVETF